MIEVSSMTEEDSIWGKKNAFQVQIMFKSQGLLTHWPLEDLIEILEKLFYANYVIDEVFLVKLPLHEFHWTLLMISQYWFR